MKIHSLTILYHLNSHSLHCYIVTKAKGLDIYIPPLTRKPEWQRFTMQSGILDSNSSG